METPLLLAVVAGQTAAVAFLLQYGADPCIVTGNPKSPMAIYN